MLLTSGHRRQRVLVLFKALTSSNAPDDGVAINLMAHQMVAISIFNKVLVSHFILLAYFLIELPSNAIKCHQMPSNRPR